MTGTRAALLVMDVQQEIVDRLPAEVDSSATLSNIDEAVRVARQSGMPVIWVIIAFRDGYPEIDSRNPILAGVISRGALLQSARRTGVHSSLSVDDHDVLIVKRRTDSFSGTDLAMVLRAADARSLVLTGVTTSGVVLSTFLTAVDNDFEVTVLSDCCVDRDPHLHDALVTKLFPARGVVSTFADWARSHMDGTA